MHLYIFIRINEGLPGTALGYSPMSFRYAIIARDTYSTVIFESMSYDARGRCHFCYKRHIVPVFGSDEEAHILLQKSNLRLVVLNTVCSPCIIKLQDILRMSFPDLPLERITVKKGHTESSMDYQSTSNLNVMKKLQVDENFQIHGHKSTEADIKVKRNIASIDTKYETNIDNSVQVPENVEDIKKKQLTCEFCQKEFNHAGDLNKHRRKHTGEQPYACNKCERKFATSSNLVRHQQIHLGIKSFRCQICERTFTRKIKLSAHLVAKHHEALKSN
ncbi:zinc finger protein 184-like isoform X2 [Pogonomyrmex barbatus]|uniref:Zinc finger protein 184-like isoform X2 n=1 Tax=Pogonomyrmex barbatus TaxID=144034 RepID=A0A6I9WSL4_9HYME|nr:zinc finger protein 184-like isoform X2 [Pogonomyrmex barbatus]